MSWITRNWDTVSVAVCLVMYATTALLRFRKGDMAMALTFAAYALANVGFIWHFLRGAK